MRFGLYMTTDEERLTVVNVVASTRVAEEPVSYTHLTLPTT